MDVIWRPSKIDVKSTVYGESIATCDGGCGIADGSQKCSSEVCIESQGFCHPTFLQFSFNTELGLTFLMRP